MDLNSVHLILKFYARCFAFPYEEMNYELQHQFRIIEQSEDTEDDITIIDQLLNIINSYQGQEVTEIREDYVRIFSSVENEKPLCSMIANEFLSGFGMHLDSFELSELFYESGLPVDDSAGVDNIINILEYLSILFESDKNDEEIAAFLEKYIVSWIPQFCDVLYKAAGISFYKEVSSGLKDFILDLSNHYV